MTTDEPQMSAWEAVAAGVAMGAVSRGLSNHLTSGDVEAIADSVFASLAAEGYAQPHREGNQR
jgi:hypothetical protein